MSIKDQINCSLKNSPKELKFLLYILSGNLKSEQYSEQDIIDMDWRLFMKLVLHHRVHPMVYLKVKEHHHSLIPPHVLEFLHAHYHNNMLKMLHLSREMSRICDELSGSGIRTLMLKGPVLGVQLYGNMAHRVSKDLDILVDADDVEKVELILQQLGYEAKDKPILGNWKKKSHHLSFYHKEHASQVEIHWRLNPHYSKNYSFEQLWERKRLAALSGQTFFQLGDEDLFSYLIDHGARHGWFRLRWLLDIDVLLKRLDTNRVIAHIQRYGGKAYTGQSLILLEVLLSANIPKQLEFLFSQKSYRLAEMAMHYITRIVQLNPAPEKSVAFHYYQYLFSLMSMKQKLSFVIILLLPSSGDATLFPLPKYLHFLYIPLRPFLWGWRKVNRHFVTENNSIKPETK